MLHAMLQGHTSHPDVKWYICQHYQHMQSNYNVDYNTKSSNYMKIQLKALDYFELQQTLK